MVSSHFSSNTVFLSILVIFSLQLSKTVATNEECRTATSTGNYPVPTEEEAEFIDQCQLSTAVTTCTVDLTNWEGYNDFQSICTTAKGEVYELDYTVTCSSSSGTVTTINVVNQKLCVAPICTSEDIKGLFLQSNNCTVSSINAVYESNVSGNVVSGSSALLGEFSLRLVEVLGGIGFLMNALI